MLDNVSKAGAQMYVEDEQRFGNERQNFSSRFEPERPVDDFRNHRYGSFSQHIRCILDREVPGKLKLDSQGSLMPRFDCIAKLPNESEAC